MVIWNLGSSTLLAFALGSPNMSQPQAVESPKAILQRATEQLIRSGLAGRALKEGQPAPDFTLPDAQGKPVTLSALLARGPVVLTFYRGGWCPYCNLQLKGYQEALGRIHALGAELVAVSPQVPDKTIDTVQKDALTFPVLSDVGHTVARKYGLVFRVVDEVIPIYRKNGIDLEASNGDASHELPMPGTYIIGKDGVVRLAHVDADYTKRLPVDRILEKLKELR